MALGRHRSEGQFLDHLRIEAMTSTSANVARRASPCCSTCRARDIDAVAQDVVAAIAAAASAARRAAMPRRRS